MKVLGFRNGDSGCDYYRCSLPLNKAREIAKLDYNETWVECVASDILLYPDDFKKKLEADIFVIQRLSHTGFIDIIQKHIKDNNLNSKIVIDFDDNLFATSPMSNTYIHDGVEDVKISFPNGTSQYLWQDGVGGFSIEKNKRRREEIIKILGRADLITTTTPILADVFRQHNQNVKVLPNYVDAREWKKLPLEKKPEEIRLFWGGGNSHWEDLFLIKEPLRQVLDKYKNVKLVILGWMPDGFADTFPGRVEFHPWTKFEAYGYKYASLGIDISLIPLVENEFSVCKSNIKWIEASSLQIPTVVSYCSPYKEVESLSDKDLAVFIDGNNPDDWVKGISMLIDNPDLRKKIGEESRMVVEQHFDVNTQYHKWIDAYTEVLDADANSPHSN